MGVIVQTAAGTPGANVYDPIDDWVTYLSSIGLTTFASRTPADRAAIAIDATERMEDEIVFRVDGFPVEPDGDVQTLLFPRFDAHDSRDRLIVGLPPLRARRAIMRAGEALAKSPKAFDLRSNLKRERVGRFEKEYMKASETFAESFPEIWAGLRHAFPRGFRQRRG